MSMASQQVFLWASPPGRTEGSRTYYTSFVLNSITYEIANCVTLFPEDDKLPHYIGKIKSAFVDTQAQDPHCIEVLWFERRVNLETNTRGIEESEREVFELGDTDVNPIGCISGKCMIIKARNYDEATSMMQGRADDWYFCRGFFLQQHNAFQSYTQEQLDMDDRIIFLQHALGPDQLVQPPQPLQLFPEVASTASQQHSQILATSAVGAAVTATAGPSGSSAVGNGHNGSGQLSFSAPFHSNGHMQGSGGGNYHQEAGGGAAMTGGGGGTKMKGDGAKGAPAAKRKATGRICAECGATATPQWREGPLGPKTLCNACGVRYVRSQQRATKKAGGGGSGGGGGRQSKNAGGAKQSKAQSPVEFGTAARQKAGAAQREQEKDVPWGNEAMLAHTNGTAAAAAPVVTSSRPVRQAATVAAARTAAFARTGEFSMDEDEAPAPAPSGRRKRGSGVSGGGMHMGTQGSDVNHSAAESDDNAQLAAAKHLPIAALDVPPHSNGLQPRHPSLLLPSGMPPSHATSTDALEGLLALPHLALRGALGTAGQQPNQASSLHPSQPFHTQAQQQPQHHSHQQLQGGLNHSMGPPGAAVGQVAVHSPSVTSASVLPPAVTGAQQWPMHPPASLPNNHHFLGLPGMLPGTATPAVPTTNASAAPVDQQALAHVRNGSNGFPHAPATPPSAAQSHQHSSTAGVGAHMQAGSSTTAPVISPPSPYLKPGQGHTPAQLQMCASSQQPSSSFPATSPQAFHHPSMATLPISPLMFGSAAPSLITSPAMFVPSPTRSTLSGSQLPSLSSLGHPAQQTAPGALAAHGAVTATDGVPAFLAASQPAPPTAASTTLPTPNSSTSAMLHATPAPNTSLPTATAASGTTLTSLPATSTSKTDIAAPPARPAMYPSSLSSGMGVPRGLGSGSGLLPRHGMVAPPPPRPPLPPAPAPPAPPLMQSDLHSSCLKAAKYLPTPSLSTCTAAFAEFEALAPALPPAVVARLSMVRERLDATVKEAASADAATAAVSQVLADRQIVADRARHSAARAGQQLRTFLESLVLLMPSETFESSTQSAGFVDQAVVTSQALPHPWLSQCAPCTSGQMTDVASASATAAPDGMTVAGGASAVADAFAAHAASSVTAAGTAPCTHGAPLSENHAAPSTAVHAAADSNTVLPVQHVTPSVPAAARVAAPSTTQPTAMVGSQTLSSPGPGVSYVAALTAAHVGVVPASSCAALAMQAHQQPNATEANGQAGQQQQQQQPPCASVADAGMPPALASVSMASSPHMPMHVSSATGIAATAIKHMIQSKILHASMVSQSDATAVNVPATAAQPTHVAVQTAEMPLRGATRQAALSAALAAASHSSPSFHNAAGLLGLSPHPDPPHHSAAAPGVHGLTCNSQEALVTHASLPAASSLPSQQASHAAPASGTPNIPLPSVFLPGILPSLPLGALPQLTTDLQVEHLAAPAPSLTAGPCSASFAALQAYLAQPMLNTTDLLSMLSALPVVQPGSCSSSAQPAVAVSSPLLYNHPDAILGTPISALMSSQSGPQSSRSHLPLVRPQGTADACTGILQRNVPSASSAPTDGSQHSAPPTGFPNVELNRSGPSSAVPAQANTAAVTGLGCTGIACGTV